MTASRNHNLHQGTKHLTWILHILQSSSIWTGEHDKNTTPWRCHDTRKKLKPFFNHTVHTFSSGHYNGELHRDQLIFGEELKKPYEELQFPHKQSSVWDTCVWIKTETGVVYLENDTYMTSKQWDSMKEMTNRAVERERSLNINPKESGNTGGGTNTHNHTQWNTHGWVF